MWYPPRLCPGGCGRTISGMSPLCGDCSLAEAVESSDRELAITGAAAQGISELEHLLRRYADFNLWLVLHAHPPV